MLSMLSMPLILAGMVISFLFASNPLLLGVMVLLFSFMCSTISSMYFSSWYAFGLFIIFIGGLMVMFSYFIALVPNQRLTMSNIWMFGFFFLLVLFSLNKDNLTTNLYSYSLLDYKGEYISNLVASVFSPSCLILLLGCLLLCLIIISKLAKPQVGPLRPF